MYIKSMGPFYIKKKDFSDFAKNRSVKLAIVNLAFALAFGILGFFIYPEILTMYQEVDAVLPYTLRISPYITAVTCLVFAFIGVRSMLQTSELSTAQKKLLVKYRAEDMVNIEEIFSTSTEYKLLLVYGIVITAFILTTVVPIYQLAGQY